MIGFTRDLIERSRSVPVVVDFWAEWCGPCRVLGPIIERLAESARGGWELVKLDTEAQPEIAAQYGIQGIPSAKMFHKGSVVAEFVGALPEEEIRRWLDANLPDPRQETLNALAGRWAAEGPTLTAELETFARDNRELDAAKLRVAQAIVATEPERARDLVRSTHTTADTMDLATDILSLADLMQVEDIPSKLAGHLREARQALVDHDLDVTLQHLINAVAVDRMFGDDLARRATVALFRLLGQGHDLTQKHQRRLSMALHS